MLVLARIEKTRPNTASMMRGVMNDHRKPSTERLYFTLSSLRVMLKRSSRCNQRSLSLSIIWSGPCPVSPGSTARFYQNGFRPGAGFILPQRCFGTSNFAPMVRHSGDAPSASHLAHPEGSGTVHFSVHLSRDALEPEPQQRPDGNEAVEGAYLLPRLHGPGVVGDRHFNEAVASPERLGRGLRTELEALAG